MVDRDSTCAMTAITQLIWWISHNHIKFHIEYLLWIFSVDELIGMGFKLSAPVIFLLACSAGNTSPIFPCMVNPLKADVALRIIESFAYRVFPVGRLGAVNASTGEQGCQLSDGNPEKLVVKNMVDPFLLVGDLLFQSYIQTFGNLPKKHPRLAEWIEKPSILIAPDSLWNQVQNLVHQLRRRENLIAAQIGQAGQYIGVIIISVQHRRASGSELRETPLPE